MNQLCKYALMIIPIIAFSSITMAFSYSIIFGPINYSQTPFNLGNNAVNFGSNDSFSLKFTMQRNNVIANECIICKTASTSFYTQGYNIFTDGQLLIIELNGQNANDITFTDMIRVRSISSVDNNKPQNLLITYNGNGSANGITVLDNGTALPLQTYQNSLTTSIKNTYNAYVGSMSNGLNNKFTGVITNLYVYSGIYTNSTIPQNYTKQIHENLSTNDLINTSSTNSNIVMCNSGYKPIGYYKNNMSLICIPDSAGQWKFDGNNVVYVKDGKFVGIGTPYADDPLIVDCRQYVIPIDCRITISGVVGKAEALMFANNANNVPDYNFNELFSIFLDNDNHFKMGHYLNPTSPNNQEFVKDVDADPTGKWVFNKLGIKDTLGLPCTLVSNPTGAITCQH